MIKFKNLLFDLDGTVIDSADEILKCLRHSLIANGLPADQNGLRRELIGPPVSEILNAAGIDRSRIPGIIKTFRSSYDHDQHDVSRLYPDARRTLKVLRQSGKRLCVVTNKPLLPTLRVLRMFDLEGCFERVYTINFPLGFKNKADIVKFVFSEGKLSKSDSCLIGDTFGDHQAASLNGIRFVAALYGYCSKKAELGAKTFYSINRLKDLVTKF